MIIVVDAGIDDIIASLSEEQKIVMFQLSRVEKSDKTNIFHQHKVERKKPCWELDVGQILKDLSKIGLINPVKKKYWQTTSLGRKVEHRIEKKRLEHKYGYPIKRTRGFP